MNIETHTANSVRCAEVHGHTNEAYDLTLWDSSSEEGSNVSPIEDEPSQSEFTLYAHMFSLRPQSRAV